MQGCLEHSAQEEQDVVPQSMSKNLTFFDLPREIRNMIYEYALVDPQYSIRFHKGTPSNPNGRHRSFVRVYRDQPSEPDRDDLPGELQRKRHASGSQDYTRHPDEAKGNKILAVALLQTCKQINEEAASISYGRNVFT